ncbi:hypothetical protein TNCV_3257311 [Trichonephila clavipes]|nr:hypothetical protein TNCV_3257311 [Trichonephila clavipes]
MIMGTQSQLWQERHFGVGSKLKKIIYADSDDEKRNDNAAPVFITSETMNIMKSVRNFDDKKEINNVAPVPTSSEMRNIMKSMHSCLDVRCNGEINSKIDDKRRETKIA